MDTVTLKFNGPFALTAGDVPLIFGDAISSQTGVYLWTVPYIGGRYIVQYVGETQKPFRERMKEHAVQTLGGNYRISHPERLRQGVDEVIWNGLWRKGTRDRLPEFIERVELATAAREMLHAIRVFVAPVDIERLPRRRIETAIARHVWSLPVPGSALLAPDIRYRRKPPAGPAIRCQVSADAHIHGFPATFDA